MMLLGWGRYTITNKSECCSAFLEMTFCFAPVVQVSGHPIVKSYLIPLAHFVSRQSNAAFSDAPLFCATVGCGSRL